MKTAAKSIKGRFAATVFTLILTLVTVAGPAIADSVDIQCLKGVGGTTQVQNNLGAALAQGSRIQVFIANGGIDAIDRNNAGNHYTAAGGNDTWVGDYVVGQGGTATDGTFYIGGATIIGQAYVRAWNNANPASATYYGVSALSSNYSNPIGASTWDVPTFSTNLTTVQTGTLQFSPATYSVAENVATATITVSRTGGSSGAASINYATSNGTATAGSDYTAANGTLSWANGDAASKTFNIPITDDAVYEGNETVNLTLSGATGATLGAPASAVLTITDDEVPPVTGSLQLSAATYNVNENSGTIPITINRTGGSSGAASINYATSNGTATAGSDYTATNGTLNWADGDAASKTFNIPITDDAVYEGNETVNLTLSGATGATLGAPASAVLTITDDEVPPANGSLQFSAATSSVAENAATATITVSRTGGSTGAVSVSYATSNGTATAGSDYTAASGTLSWANGDTASKTFNIPITDDAVYEGNETVNLALSGPTGGAALGTPNTAVLTITDDETPPTNSLTLTSPKTGDIIYGGSAVKLYWTSTGTIANIKIELSPDGGSTWGAFGATVPNTGSLESSMTWANTTEAITTMQLRISDAANPATSFTSGNFTLAPATIPTSIVIDDFEGGSVGTWQAPNLNSGYFAFGAGVTPGNSTITATGPNALAAKNGAKGMQVKFDYDATAPSPNDWGGGWGATLIKKLDLTAMKKLTMNIKWDGSTNGIKFALKDSDGTSFAANIPNSSLTALSGYGQIAIDRSAFSYDADGSKADTKHTTPDNVMNWTSVEGYSFVYITKGTSTNAQNIDDITAVTTDEVTPPPPVTGESPAITAISPTAAPAGTMIGVTGVRFGTPQGGSHLDFENQTTKVSYQAQITAWSDTSITAYVPKLASAGTYEVKVVRVAIAAGTGTITALQSNPANFQVTASGAGDLAIIWPNPFDPNSQTVSIAVTDTAGASRLGFYIFDMTAKLVKKEVITSGNQISWNGYDQAGAIVADGAYLLRAINEETKSLLAKGKILVIKH